MVQGETLSIQESHAYATPRDPPPRSTEEFKEIQETLEASGKDTGLVRVLHPTSLLPSLTNHTATVSKQQLTRTGKLRAAGYALPYDKLYGSCSSGNQRSLHFYLSQTNIEKLVENHS